MNPKELSLPTTLPGERFGKVAVLLTCLIGSGIGIWLVCTGKLFGIAFLLLAPFALFAGIQLLPGAAYLRLTEQDFTYCLLFRARTVRWRDVEKFAAIRVGKSYMVAWNFAPHVYDAPGKSALSKWQCGYEGSLPEKYGMTATELAELLENLRQKYFGSSPSKARES